ncbi:MAG: YbjN domain-containing protein [bacterium]|nr:YbjN domain-containing protein [bacterium]
MKCPNCKTVVPASAAYCPSCGNAMSRQDPGKTPGEVSPEWLAHLLCQDGYYDVEVTPDEEVVRGKHKTRPNIVLRIRRDLGCLTMLHWWSLKPSGIFGGGSVQTAVNKANNISWLNSFYLDKDGDLAVSSQIWLGRQVGSEDILTFLDRNAKDFMAAVAASGLQQHLK